MSGGVAAIEIVVDWTKINLLSSGKAVTERHFVYQPVDHVQLILILSGLRTPVRKRQAFDLHR